jgi:NitT/TauT family transport system permease protein
MLEAGATHRPEIYRETLGPDQFGIVEKPLTAFERLYDQAWLRKLFVLVVLAGLWEGYALWLDNELLVPTSTATVRALIAGVASGTIIERAFISTEVLQMGYGVGLLLATLLTFFAINTHIGTDFLETMTAMLNPLPAIAPAAAGPHLVRSRYRQSRFCPRSLRPMGGGAQYPCKLPQRLQYAPDGGAQLCAWWPQVRGERFLSLPHSRAFSPALKIGWAFAWRTLIAAELVFGTTSGQGGLGWYIFEAKNNLSIPEMFAGLLSIILIGLFVEDIIFRFIEANTVQRWGMQS